MACFVIDFLWGCLKHKTLDDKESMTVILSCSV